MQKKPKSGIFGQFWPDLKKRVEPAQTGKKKVEPEEPEFLKKIGSSRLNSTFSKRLAALANSNEFAISS